jgi:hypothetical protein
MAHLPATMNSVAVVMVVVKTSHSGSAGKSIG